MSTHDAPFGFRPCPKPVRGSRPPAEQLRRAAVDLAAFKVRDLTAVHGPTRICFQTAKQATFQEPVDAHHILGRGNDETRLAHSSVLNCAYLRRDIHTGPLRDAPDQVRVYLRVALTKVIQAVGQGRYELNENDQAFIEYIRGQQPFVADIYATVNLD